MKEFNSEYANVCLKEDDQVILLTWKKEAHLDDYRTPAQYALDLMQQNPSFNLVVDARNGFEDDKRCGMGISIFIAGYGENQVSICLPYHE